MPLARRAFWAGFNRQFGLTMMLHFDSIVDHPKSFPPMLMVTSCASRGTCRSCGSIKVVEPSDPSEPDDEPSEPMEFDEPKGLTCG